jgi:hypothetical protein
VGDLFPPIKINKHSKKPTSEGNVEFITSSSYNNGVSYYCDEDAIDGNCITVSTNGKCFDCFYHKNAIVVSTDVEVLYSKFLNELNGLFICSVLQQEQKKYDFTDKPKNGKVFDTIIKLPTTPNGQPDWDYMESYMKAVMEESEKSLENLKRADDTKHLIDVSEWGDMCIGDYFEVEYGTFRPKDKLGVGDYNYITTSGFNNGITDKIDVADHQGGCITVASDGALMGTAFYQEEPFSTSNIVSTLTPFETTPLNKYNAQFICALIFSKRSEFGWLGFKFSVDRVRNLIIKVPVTATGKPNWNYMEEYMRSIINKTEKAVEDLRKPL